MTMKIPKRKGARALERENLILSFFLEEFLKGVILELGS
jgi:hypothetical protein